MQLRLTVRRLQIGAWARSAECQLAVARWT